MIARNEQHSRNTSMLSRLFQDCLPCCARQAPRPRAKRRSNKKLKHIPPAYHLMEPLARYRIEITPHGEATKPFTVEVIYNPKATHSTVPERCKLEGGEIDVLPLSDSDPQFRGFFGATWTPDDGETTRSEFEDFYLTSDDVHAVLKGPRVVKKGKSVTDAYPIGLGKQTPKEKEDQKEKEKEREQQKKIKLDEHDEKLKNQHQSSHAARR